MFPRALLLWLACSLTSAFAADTDALDRVRDWSNRQLTEALVPGADLNLVSSLSFPLTHDVTLTGNATSRATLQKVRDYLGTLDVAKLECGQLADLFLTAGFLDGAGVAMDVSGAEARLKECNLGNRLFDLANSLLFVCRYTDWDHRSRLPGALERLQAAQAEDGQFLSENGRPWYYLSSHALLAVYECGGDATVIRRGQDYLQRVLSGFRDAGFHDGLTESLIFLHWMGRDIPERDRYHEHLLQAVHDDGGICFQQKPGCEAHWHAVSLLMEWLLLQRPGD